MDLKSLRYFAEVARQKSFTEAADKLCVTQPTLSRQIADLEDELGHKLFDRTTRRIELTEKGLFLFSQAQTILALCDKVRLEVMSDADLSGDITISGAETPAAAVVMRAAARLQSKHPNVRIHLRSSTFPQAREDLTLGIADFAIFMLPTELDDLETIDLPGASRWGVLTGKDSPLAGKRSVCAADLETLPLFMPKSRHPQSCLSGWLGHSLDALNIAGTYTLMYNAAFLASAGTGVLGIDGIVAEAATGTVFLPLSPELPARSVIAWPQNRMKKNLTEAFLAELRTCIEEEKASSEPAG